MATHSSDETLILWNQLNVKEGKLDDVKQVLKKLCDLAATEQGTLTYTFAFNDDETKLYATEIFANVEAFMEHMKHVGEVLPGLVDNTEPGSLTVVTTQDEHEKLKEILAAFPHNAVVTFSGVRKKTE